MTHSLTVESGVVFNNYDERKWFPRPVRGLLLSPLVVF